MIDLNKTANESLLIATERQANGANIKTDTRAMLKHTATEVVEAGEVYAMAVHKTFCDSGNEEAIKALNKEFAGELADIINCVLIIAAYEEIDIEKALADCLKKNRLRALGKGDKK